MSFAADLKQFNGRTKDRLDRVRRTIIIKLFSAVIMDTPVLDGRLRGNWRTGIRSPVVGVIDRDDPSGAQALAEMRQLVSNSRFEDDALLTNNLPYADRIEYEGWSKKAPEGMVRRNVARFQRLVDDAVREGRI